MAVIVQVQRGKDTEESPDPSHEPRARTVTKAPEKHSSPPRALTSQETRIS